MTLPGRGPWHEWTLEDWNQALLDHYFRADGSTDHAITRLLVTPRELARVTGDATAPRETVQEAFLSVLRQPRRKFNQSISSDRWLGPAGELPVDHTPGCLAYLILSCLVASAVTDGLIDVGNFRNRLAHLLGNPPDESYPLVDLPVLWEGFRRWLETKRALGAPYRRLVLPDPAHYTLIGYPLRLAFPARKDEKRLVEILEREGLGKEPPVPLVLRLVQRHLETFTPAFIEAFEQFRNAFQEGRPRLFEDPFWTAVREVSALDFAGRDDAESSTLEFVMFLNRDCRFDMALASSKEVQAGTGQIRYQASEATLGQFRSVVSVDVPSQEDGVAWAVKLFLNGALQNVIPEIVRSPLWSVVREGAVLFVADDWDVYVAAVSRPTSGRIRALLREDIAEHFFGALPEEKQLGHRPSWYHGWLETDPFVPDLLDHLDEADGVLSVGPLSDVRVLQPVVRPPAIHLSGGIRVPGGFLGLRGGLPRVTVDVPVDRLQAHFDTGAYPRGAPTPIDLIPLPQSPDTFVFPETEDPLDGKWTLVGFRGAEVEVQRSVAFRPAVVSTAYKEPTESVDWLVESTGPAAVPFYAGGLEAAGENDEVPEERLLFLQRGDRASPDNQGDIVEAPTVDIPAMEAARRIRTFEGQTDRVQQFIEGCAATAANRSGIREPEFLERIQETFQIGDSSPLVWDIVRGWVESGAFDRAVYLRWRGRKYFARRPHFVLHRGSTGLMGTLVGLIPMSTRNRVTESARRHGAKRDRTHTFSHWLPPVMRWSAESPQVFHEIAQECYLPPSRRIRPLADLLVPIVDVAAHSGSDALNFQTAGWWCWEEGSFSSRGKTSCGGVAIEWLRRSDKPDRFRVRFDEQWSWCTVSRNWALLVGYSLTGTSPFGIGREAQVLRSVAGQVFLPVPLGRLAAVRGTVVPGPTQGFAAGGYAYSFSTAQERNEVLSLLWGSSHETVDVHRVRWLLTVAGHQPPTEVQPRIPIPPHLRNLLRETQLTQYMPSDGRLPAGVIPLISNALDQ